MMTTKLREELNYIFSEAVRDFGGYKATRSFKKFGKVRRQRGLVKRDQTIQQAIRTPILGPGNKKTWMP